MMARRVMQEIGVVGGKKRPAAELGDARSTAVEEARRGFDHKAFVCGETWILETFVETHTEVDVLPPGRLEGRIEPAEGFPHVPTNQPRRRRRLRNRGGGKWR